MKTLRLLFFLIAMMFAYAGTSAQPSGSLIGDVNGDGAVNAADIAELVDIILVGNFGGTPIVAVDLDLPSGTLWADMNVGASKSEDYGDYFAWGETLPQSDKLYSWSSYKWCNGNSSSLTKYCNDSSNGNNGFTDSKTILDAEDDAATANWGGNWCMPTYKQWVELYNNTNSEWTTQNGVNGYKFTSKTNGNSVFFPAAGGHKDGGLYDVGSNCYYWLSAVWGDNQIGACRLHFNSSGVSLGDHGRRYGLSVRPVRIKGKWQAITDDFNKSIPFTKIRVLNKKSSNGSDCCISFSTEPNENVNTDNYYVSLGSLTIGDNRPHDIERGFDITSCKYIGYNWYEYEFSCPVYFAYYQINCPRGQVMAFITDSW